jgi:hypothetical protein
MPPREINWERREYRERQREPRGGKKPLPEPRENDRTAESIRSGETVGIVGTPDFYNPKVIKRRQSPAKLRFPKQWTNTTSQNTGVQYGIVGYRTSPKSRSCERDTPQRRTDGVEE